jgi:hypothetical protein
MSLAAAFEGVTEPIYGRTFALRSLPCLPTIEAWRSAFKPGCRLPTSLLRWILPLPLSPLRNPIPILEFFFCQ